MHDESRERHFQSLSPHGFHRVVYDEWGDPGNPRVVICVHGVGRNARDFDDLAAALAGTHRVLSVDMPGRGRSDWLADPNDYVFPTYLTVLTALIARSGAETVGWVGTSMGGLLGIIDGGAAATRRSRGSSSTTSAPRSSLPRSSGSAGTSASTRRSRPTTRSRITSVRFRRRSDRSPTRNGSALRVSNVRQRADGRWGLAYDPGIAVPFRAAAAPPDLWPLWDAIRCPTLVLRGTRIGPAVGRNRGADGRPRSADRR